MSRSFLRPMIIENDWESHLRRSQHANEAHHDDQIILSAHRSMDT